MEEKSNSRRNFIQTLVMLPVTYLLASFHKKTEAAGIFKLPLLIPTPECGDQDEETPRQTAGPFYTPNSPKRTSLLEPGIAGIKIFLTGYVFNTQSKPIANALVDFWHCDASGVYDNEGYKLRGHQFTDNDGKYSLTTIIPGLYPGRTRHIHVRVQPANQKYLTTQLYFPGEPENDGDTLFNPVLLMNIRDNKDGKSAEFNFVIKT